MTATLIFPASTSGFLAVLWRKLHRLVGFQEGYNFVLWSIFGGAVVGFTLIRVTYLDYFGVFCRKNFLSQGNHAAPGECYYFLNGGREQIGMMLHLYGIIPCSLLQFLQFIPAIRQRFVLVHRINGHIVVLLMAIAIVGGLMALSGSFGGEPAWQAAVMVHSIMVTTGLVLAMVNIKKLQIEQHRAWMLRTWIWAFCIVTMRVLQQVGARLLSDKGYFALKPCAQIASDGVLSAAVITAHFPECEAYFLREKLGQTVMVEANYAGLPIEINVALSFAAGASAFLALIVHIFGAELYLHLTPAESDRLRNVSYHKQLAAGMRHPGRAGLTADRVGDAARWCPRMDKKLGLEDSDEVSIIAHVDCRKE
ncbi:unnamed protein product [Discula destructiva]